MKAHPPGLVGCSCAEVLGTFILVFFGCGAVHAAVLAGAQSGLWQVAIVWAGAIMVAVYVVGGISGAHINPAITIALAAFGRFPWSRVAPYVVSQLAGAFLAGGTLYVLFAGFLVAKERELDIVRGQPGSELTAMCYGEYFPNPGPISGVWRERLAKDPRPSASELAEILRRHLDLCSPETAFLAELIGTAMLALVVFGLTDPRNSAAPLARLAPVFIGLTVALLISVIAPLTQACFNPARDFGPRLVAWLGGWGDIALPGPRGNGYFFTVYIAAPTLGALCGGGLYAGLLCRWLPPIEETPA
jgi:glycerol uptake facilitator protein